MGLKIKNTGGAQVPETGFGVCLWQVPSGGYIRDTDDNYLSLEGRLNDPQVERKMAEAAKYWMGSKYAGQPVWFPDRRKISQDEYEDQMARMEEGKIPDVRDWRS